MEMTAIAFAAPGIGVAEALLFGQDMKSTNRLTSITVQPQNDIVSRIDPCFHFECRMLCNHGWGLLSLPPLSLQASRGAEMIYDHVQWQIVGLTSEMVLRYVLMSSTWPILCARFLLLLMAPCGSEQFKK